MIKVCAPFLGRGFSLGIITVSALACSGTTFKGAPADPDETDTTVKVSYRGQTYRSGWISGFTWPQTNLGIIRFTGENNSRVYAGDAVYVGPLSGCQKLTDAAIEALFKD